MKKFLIVAVLGLVAFVAWPEPAKAERYVEQLASWEIAAPGANTDAITNITWDQSYPLRLTIQCDTGTIVNLMVSRDGTENALGMNANTAVTAGGTYTWDVHGIKDGDIVNVQVETDSAIALLAIGQVRPR